MFRTELGPDQLREPITISALEFDVLWEHLRLAVMPLVLRVPSPGKTHTERAGLVRRTWEGLSARGLGREVAPDPTLVELLTLLDRPEREVDGRIWLGRSVRLLAAAKGESAVLAVLTGDALTLRYASAEGLPREALSVLPAAHAGPGHSVTLPSADLDAAAAEASTPEELEKALRGRGVRADDARTLAAMVTDAGNRGQFGAAARDRFGRRVRGERVVAFFDTPKGRYVQMRREFPGGTPWSTISPADPRRLHQHVSELYGEVVQAA
ncbi:ESX secretion-associated protein EspG [Gandjariella thermophila]|uniref:ESX secretion-associated protein EspG n=1 Tax=Gandjariella thermophila TaxID=1931992 RepID=A0A4D4J172_9PSEU|nr:ESX secretion-associated protein EspG [Gandjariella thermophila]GDY29154.1 ESX secretion-associated protein EspG [Gandjariella thermophila]